MTALNPDGGSGYHMHDNAVLHALLCGLTLAESAALFLPAKKQNTVDYLSAVFGCKHYLILCKDSVPLRPITNNSVFNIALALCP